MGGARAETDFSREDGESGWFEKSKGLIRTQHLSVEGRQRIRNQTCKLGG